MEIKDIMQTNNFMTTYVNLNQTSGITHYEIGEDFIKIKFKGNFSIYKYTYLRTRSYHVEIMKKLAIEGRGLNKYINDNIDVKNSFIKTY